MLPISTVSVPLVTESPFIIEELVPFKKELATTIARNQNGEIEIFPIVEMMFNEISNQVEFVICP